MVLLSDNHHYCYIIRSWWTLLSKLSNFASSFCTLVTLGIKEGLKKVCFLPLLAAVRARLRFLLAEAPEAEESSTIILEGVLSAGLNLDSYFFRC